MIYFKGNRNWGCIPPPFAFDLRLDIENVIAPVQSEAKELSEAISLLHTRLPRLLRSLFQFPALLDYVPLSFLVYSLNRVIA